MTTGPGTPLLITYILVAYLVPPAMVLTEVAAEALGVTTANGLSETIGANRLKIITRAKPCTMEIYLVAFFCLFKQSSFLYEFGTPLLSLLHVSTWALPISTCKSWS